MKFVVEPPDNNGWQDIDVELPELGSTLVFNFNVETKTVEALVWTISDDAKLVATLAAASDLAPLPKENYDD